MKYGLREISDAWRILEMILVKDVEIDRIRPAYDAFQDPVRVNSRNWKDDRNFNYLFHESDISKKMFNNKHRFYWGTHPFGRTWLIKEIMKYFEIKGNIQMLAMLSCILFENANNVKYPDLYNIPIHTPYHALPPPPQHQLCENLMTKVKSIYTYIHTTRKIRPYLNLSLRIVEMI